MERRQEAEGARDRAGRVGDGLIVMIGSWAAWSEVLKLVLYRGCGVEF